MGVGVGVCSGDGVGVGVSSGSDGVGVGVSTGSSSSDGLPNHKSIGTPISAWVFAFNDCLVTTSSALISESGNVIPITNPLSSIALLA